MSNFQAKRKLEHLLQSTPVLILLAILVLLFAWSVFGFMDIMLETLQNKKLAENKITELQKEKNQLSTDLNKLKTNKGIEENIRDKFGLAKEGEGLIVVIDDQNSPVNPANTQSKGFLGLIKSWFINR